jgi:hypothetical protein
MEIKRSRQFLDLSPLLILKYIDLEWQAQRSAAALFNPHLVINEWAR